MDGPQHAQLFGSHFFDYGLPGSLADDAFSVLFDGNTWSANTMQIPGFNDGFWSADMIYDPANRTDVAESPGQQSQHTGTEGSDSLSPDDASGHILTPSSTNYSPYVADLDDPESDVASGSPESERSAVGDFVHVVSPEEPRRQSETREQSQAPRPSPRIAASVQSSSFSTRATASPSLQDLSMASQQWQASLVPSTQSGIEDFAAAAYPSFAGSHDFQLYDDSAILANVGNSFDQAFASQQQSDSSALPSRSHDGTLQTVQANFSPQAHSLAAVQYMNNTMAYPSPGQPMYPAGGTVASQYTLQSQHGANIGDLALTAFQIASSSQQAPSAPGITHNKRNAINVSALTSQSTRTPAAARSHGQPRPRVQVRTFPGNSGGNSPSSSARSNASSQYESFDYNGSYPVIAVADPTRVQGNAQRALPADKILKGGRKKNSHLPDVSRQRSHAMRKVGACWRCVMQRDPCDAPEGGCCSRCVMRASRGQTYFFDCDRSKLPDFVHEFLPASLLHDHQKQSIETFVSREVVHWHVDNGIDVYLSSGYGPPLPWKLYEFTPRSHEFLYQVQVMQDPQSRRSLPTQKYSPPYGLLKIDSVDDRNYEAYLEDLLQPQWLKELGESAYAEENLVDEGMFQCKVVDLMCQLYIGTRDATLKPLLGDVLRMIIITYIMGHTLTITEDTLYPVINNIRHTPRPPACQKHTSPRLANRQLKFFFHIVRNGIYEKILKWQQHTLHTAGKKQETWLHAFCVTLGFAMVLEEVQRTMMCQADAKIVRAEASPDAAYEEARQHCDNIDKRFKLLIGLFQCKYRDRKWTGQGSFGNGTPEFLEPVAHSFLVNLRMLVEDREAHLRSREHVPFSPDNQSLYTTRLTARFLLPFLNLPAS